MSVDHGFHFLKSIGAEQFVQALDQPVCDPPRLLEISSPRPPLPGASWRLLAVLLILCLLPRAWRAAKLDVPCPDGTFYMQLASSLERGDYGAAFEQMPLNTYPLVLAGLHHCGLDFPLAGKLWGVLLGTLTVLPLFGWLRRQTDDRIAVISSLFYAAHPTFIEWCPELVRDGTFWFLAALALYFAFRAVTEVRIAHYLVTGLVLTLAVHTRFEGWFLFIPVLLWAGWRWFALAEQRGRLLFGVVTCLAICPTLVCGAQLLWPQASSSHPWGSMHRVVYVQNWLKSLVGIALHGPNTPTPKTTPPESSPQTAVPTIRESAPLQIAPADAHTTAATATPPAPTTEAKVPPPATDDSQRSSEVYRHYTSDGVYQLLPPRKALALLLQTLYRGVDAAFGICLLVGWWNWRYVWIRRDFFPLFLITMAVMAGMWIHLTQVYGSSSRYALPLALAAMPYPAVGLLTICRGIRWLFHWLSGRQAVLAYVFGGLMLLISTAGWVDALTAHEPGRERDAALGRWLKSEFGENRRVAMAGHMNLVGYFAACQGFNITFYEPPLSLAHWLEELNPDLLLIHRRELLPRALQVLVGEANRLGWQTVATERLPGACRTGEYIILARPQPLAARSPADASHSPSSR